ncbi:type II toxin-antitoxin system HicA family toxin [Myroides sp. LJL116]
MINVSELRNSTKLIKFLESQGWVLRPKKNAGSHFTFKKEGVDYLVTVPPPKKDLPEGTVKSILKKAGVL